MTSSAPDPRDVAAARSVLRRGVLLGFAVALGACGPGSRGAPEDGGETLPSTPEPPTLEVIGERPVPGGSVELRARGLPASSEVHVGVGPAQSEYEIVDTVQTGPDGSVRTTAAVPEWVEPGTRLVWVVETPDHALKALSEPVPVVAAGRGAGEAREGAVTVTGVLTDEGVECPALRSLDGTLYTLARETGAFSVGDTVRVQGRVAEMSFCMQGTTLSVDRIERAGSNGSG